MLRQTMKFQRTDELRVPGIWRKGRGRALSVQETEMRRPKTNQIITVRRPSWPIFRISHSTVVLAVRQKSQNNCAIYPIWMWLKTHLTGIPVISLSNPTRYRVSFRLGSVLRRRKCAGHHVCLSLVIKTLAQNESMNSFDWIKSRISSSFPLCSRFSAAHPVLSGFLPDSRITGAVSCVHFIVIFIEIL